MTRLFAIRAGCAVLGLTLLAGPCLAADPVAAIAPSAAQAAVQPQSDEQLDSLNGKGVETSVVAMTEQDLTAISTGNTITAANVGSGMINLQDNALSGFSGVGNFVMNTGHNNNLQSSLSVTIVVTQ